MDVTDSQIFELESDVLAYDWEKSILLCRSKSSGRKKWAKKIEPCLINHIIEDDERYYISCEYGEASGQYLALGREDGTTAWFIPGRSFLHLIFEGHVYSIFVDDKDNYYLLKIDREDGKKIWHYPVDSDLTEYSFKKDRILLKYLSGKTEKISVSTGFNI